MAVAFNQHIYNKTNQCILQYTKKVPNSLRVDMPRDLQMLLMSLFWRCSCNNWASCVQPGARIRPSRRFGAAHQVFVVVKSSDILTTCSYFDNILNLTFLMHVVFSATLSRLLPFQLGFERFQCTSFKLNLVCWDQSKLFNMRPWWRQWHSFWVS